MTKRTRDLAKRGTGGVTGESGQVIRLVDLVAPVRSSSLIHRVVPAHLACRIGARPRPGSGRGRWITHPAQPRRSGHQLSASRSS